MRSVHPGRKLGLFLGTSGASYMGSRCGEYALCEQLIFLLFFLFFLFFLLVFF